MKIYIAGPIKGKPNKNEDAFREAALVLRLLLHEPLVPLDITPYKHEGVCPGSTLSAGESDEHMSGCYMRNDIIEMLKCDAIILLKGWEHSAGARVEFIVAQACGLEILYEE